MQDSTPARPRRTIDKVILVVVALCLGISVVRVGLAAATVPYAMYVSHRAAAKAKAAGLPAPTESLTSRVSGSWPFETWWGGRKIPFRAGGDYLKVLRHGDPSRTLGIAVGLLANQLRDQGAVINRVLLPVNELKLYGGAAGTPMTAASGETSLSSWRPPSRDAAFVTTIPVPAKSYDPVLTSAQLAKLQTGAGLKERSESVFVAAPRPGESGTWIVLAEPVVPRVFLLVPIEESPVGGGL